MKKLLAFSLILCGSAASAQYATPGAGPFALVGPPPSPLNGYVPTAPRAPDYGLRDASITPTMQRQREERAALVRAMFPNLESELAGHGWSYARQLYAKAEREALLAQRAGP